MELLAEDFTKQRQDLVLTRIHLLDDGRKVKTHIRRNSYDFQSEARVEVWTDAGWKFVYGLPGEHDLVAALPSYVTRDLAAAQRSLRSLAGVLEATALAVVAT